MMKGIRLYDYQLDMKQRIEAAFRSHQSVMVQMPTGTGKTYLLAAVVSEYIARNQGRVWIVAHRRELVCQISDTIKRYIRQENLPMVSVMSIQWLSLHYREIKVRPVLIVIDEAHHALARTYSSIMNAFPEAKKLGVKATPCRLNGKGFTGLFELLLTSWSMNHFIVEGYLSLYDYYSIRPDSEEQRKIDSLRKRSVDGDYQQKEMGEVLDKRPSIERLCRTVREYAPGKKGIVYAINIAHAEHIATYYRKCGIHAVAISSKTPQERRDEMIRRFRSSVATAGHPCIDVLVNVDLFSEGFDCPDVEFIQLARPTLSLSKYLQMVGRGLRVAKGKEYCVILDNVGLYKQFGLPSADRDWQQWFEGNQPERKDALSVGLNIIDGFYQDSISEHGDEDMIRIFDHEGLKKAIGRNFGFRAITSKDGLSGVVNGEGRLVVALQYKHIQLTEDGFAFCYNSRPGRRPWTDLKNEIWFHKRPKCIELGGIEFSGEDERRLYPRICSKWIDETAWLNRKIIELQVGRGVSWKGLFILWYKQDRVYRLVDAQNSGMRVYHDENGKTYIQNNLDQPLVEVDHIENVDAYCKKCAEQQDWIHDNLMLFRKERRLRVNDVNRILKGLVDGYSVLSDRDGILDVRTKNGEEYWIDTQTNTKHLSRPVLRKRGYVELLVEGNMTFVRNIRKVVGMPFENWCIKADDNICTIYNNLYLKDKPYYSFKIKQRSDDFSYFLVKIDFSLKGKSEFWNMKITQYPGEGLKCTYVKPCEDMSNHNEIKG